MPKAIDEALHRDEREREQRLSEIEIGPNGTSLTFLQQVYRNPSLPLSTRMRAAGIAIQFEHAKLGVSVTVPWSEEMAERLEQAIARSAQVMNVIEPPPPQIDHQPALEQSQPEQSSISAPIGSVPDRRFRSALKTYPQRYHAVQRCKVLMLNYKVLMWVKRELW